MCKIIYCVNLNYKSTDWGLYERKIGFKWVKENYKALTSKNILKQNVTIISP